AGHGGRCIGRVSCVDYQSERFMAGAMPEGERAGPGLEGADLIADLLGGFGPIDGTDFFFKAGGLCGLGWVLWLDDGRGAMPLCENCESLVNGGDAKVCETVFQLGMRFVGTDGGCELNEDWAAIEARRHVNDGDAGFGFAIQ